MTVGSDGSYSYAPSADVTGTDSFVYTVSDGAGGTDSATVTITVKEVTTDDPPVASDDMDMTLEDFVLVRGAGSGVLANDTDIDSGNVLTVTSFGQGSNGSVTIGSDGSYSYAPSQNFVGTDSFTYTITDNLGAQSTATVNVTVNQIDDAVAIGGNTSGSGDEDAGAITGTRRENSLLMLLPVELEPMSTVGASATTSTWKSRAWRTSRSTFAPPAEIPTIANRSGLRRATSSAWVPMEPVDPSTATVR